METPVLKSLFNKAAQPFSSATLLKETPTQMFSCDYCEIFMNTYFGEHLQRAASVYSKYLLKYKNCHKKSEKYASKEVLSL